MKILFAGPSLPDAAAFCGGDIDVRPPATHGNVLAAVRAGATAIGLVDGGFEHVAPVWHKEILHALDEGVAVFGAASMGALRAAECDRFGMIGVGRIYEDYASGKRVDDADVALLHGPAELGYPPLSLPLVNAEATFERLEMDEAIDKHDISNFRTAARSLFYKERTWRAIVERAGKLKEHDAALQLLHASHVNQKRADALALVHALSDFRPKSLIKQGSWTFRSTTQWRAATGQPKT